MRTDHREANGEARSAIDTDVGTGTERSSPRVVLVDSGVPASLIDSLAGFTSVCDSDDALDRLGHGSALLATLAWHRDLATIDLGLVKLFDGRLATTTARLGLALETLLDAPPDWVLVSAGVARRDRRLGEVVAELRKAGTQLVASSARHGEPVYPAACEGVRAVTGDARRAPGELARASDGRYLACAWAARGAGSASGARPWQAWDVGPPLRDQLATSWLGGASFAAAHALGIWLAAGDDRGHETRGDKRLKVTG